MYLQCSVDYAEQMILIALSVFQGDPHQITLKFCIYSLQPFQLVTKYVPPFLVMGWIEFGRVFFFF